MTIQVKTTSNFINHSNCEVTDSMSFNCKNDIWRTEIINPYRFRSHLLERHKFESVDWHKVKVALKFYQI